MRVWLPAGLSSHRAEAFTLDGRRLEKTLRLGEPGAETTYTPGQPVEIYIAGRLRTTVRSANWSPVMPTRAAPSLSRPGRRVGLADGRGLPSPRGVSKVHRAALMVRDLARCTGRTPSHSLQTGKIDIAYQAVGT